MMIRQPFNLAGSKSAPLACKYKKRSPVWRTVVAWQQTQIRHPSDSFFAEVDALLNVCPQYLDDPKIPATNNFGEGLIRFAVLLHKIGCCNQSERGVKTFDVLSSLLAAFRRRSLDFADWVIKLLTGSCPKSVPLDLLPAGVQSKLLLYS